ncbi:family 5 extracellular solute-binding protein [Halosimplex carlsbadense 2-9-1]|uniref:Family 5 extracellular solute-binding protein n=1 Tax=Halosimplex carlsbadense 2-9-1 TaxID=797114 RepID=M0CHF8_9EURY|nr:ABC transporter substrate-binding protein [Halosimplex carlsbadense]ELZ22671.1 family 5 extracellular solute-binding protein [Halosimplex carlsbadense 2-9-1]
MSDNQNHGSNGTPMSRRRMMQLLGVTGAATGLAGCGGQSAVETDTQGDGGSDGSDGSDGGDGGSGTPESTATPEGFDSTSMATIQELAYVTNQTLPVLPIMEKLAQSFQATDDWNVPSADSEKMQVYWPTSWLPRTGDWTLKEGADDERLTLAQWAVPADSQYNVWNGTNDGEARRMIFDRFMRYNVATREYHPYVISDWSVDESTLTLSVREGQTWHDGEPVTGTDVANHIKLDLYNSAGGGGIGPYVLPEGDMNAVPDRVQATGDKTVEVTLEQPVNEDILLSLLAPTRLRAYDEVYGEYVTALDEAESEEERSSALGELTEFTDAEPIGNGPFQWEDADSQRTLVSKYEDHPDADNINFSEAEYLYKPQNSGRWSSLINGETDGSATLFMPQNQTRRLPDHMQTALVSRHWGMGIVFNHDKEPVNDVRVRKAVANVINREDAAGNSAAGTGSKVAVTYPSGLTGEFNDQIEGHWLDGVADEFDTYGRAEKRTERAAELLRDAGYEKQNGTWQKDGEALSLPIKGPAGFSDWVSGVQTIVSHLQDFGIESEPIMQDSATYWGGDYVEGDFKLALQGWASYDHTHPYFHFDWIYRSGDATDYWNVPTEYEAPILHEDLRDSETIAPDGYISDLATPQE